MALLNKFVYNNGISSRNYREITFESVMMILGNAYDIREKTIEFVKKYREGRTKLDEFYGLYVDSEDETKAELKTTVETLTDYFKPINNMFDTLRGLKVGRSGYTLEQFLENNSMMTTDRSMRLLAIEVGELLTSTREICVYVEQFVGERSANGPYIKGEVDGYDFGARYADAQQKLNEIGYIDINVTEDKGIVDAVRL